MGSTSVGKAHPRLLPMTGAGTTAPPGRVHGGRKLMASVQQPHQVSPADHSQLFSHSGGFSLSPLAFPTRARLDVGAGK